MKMRSLALRALGVLMLGQGLLTTSTARAQATGPAAEANAVPAATSAAPAATAPAAAAPAAAAPAAAEAPSAAAAPAPAEAPPAAASAEPAAQDRMMDFSVAPAPVALQRKDYMHEGLYLRINVGPGFAQSLSGTSATGFTVGTDVMVGGSPSPGMVLGGGALTNVVLANGNGAYQYMIGPFFDAFPNPRRGGHLGALVGLNGIAGSGGGGVGAGGAVFGGYDWWVAPEWSVGLFLKASAGFADGNAPFAVSANLSALISLSYN